MQNRKIIRAQWYDYRSSGGYFITICTKKRKHYFGEIKNGEMNLNTLGIYCDQEIEKMSRRMGVEVHTWIVMPNHIHILLVTYGIRDDGRDNITRRDGHTAHPDIVYTRFYNTDGLIGCFDSKDGLIGRPYVGRPYVGRSNGRLNYNTKRKITESGFVYIHLGQIINILKGNVTKYALQNHISFAWQSRYHDHIIRNTGEYERIQYYIQNNPSNRKSDSFF